MSQENQSAQGSHAPFPDTPWTLVREAQQRPDTELVDKHHFDHWKQAKNKADWASRQLAAAIRREISKYVDLEEEVDEELRDLLR